MFCECFCNRETFFNFFFKKAILNILAAQRPASMGTNGERKECNRAEVEVDQFSEGSGMAASNNIDGGEFLFFKITSHLLAHWLPNLQLLSVQS